MSLATRTGSAELGEAIAAAQAAALPHVRLVAVSVAVERLDAATLAGTAINAGTEVAAWMRPATGFAVVGVGRAWSVEAEGPDRFVAADLVWREVARTIAVTSPGDGQGRGPILLGGMGFGDWRHRGEPWVAFPPSSMVLPALTYREADGRASLTAVVARDAGPATVSRLVDGWSALESRVGADADRSLGHPDREPRWRVIDRLPDQGAWERSVGLLAGAVGRGRLDKVVLARQVELRAGVPVDVGSVLHRLVDGGPESTTFAFRRGDRVFLGATPELLVRTSGWRFHTLALAGSTGRGATHAEDDLRAAALLRSDKDREEHAIVVDALRAVLAPITARLDVDAVPELLRLPHVTHLATRIEGHLSERHGPLALAGRLHPTPAVAGSPTDLALALIGEHEPFERGWYAGPVGWVNADGDGELMVALRSGVVAGDRAWLYAGCGIVGDSDAAAEWAESELKLRPMLAALSAEDAR
jgi:isochorismate synthase